MGGGAGMCAQYTYNTYPTPLHTIDIHAIAMGSLLGPMLASGAAEEPTAPVAVSSGTVGRLAGVLSGHQESAPLASPST